MPAGGRLRWRAAIAMVALAWLPEALAAVAEQLPKILSTLTTAYEVHHLAVSESRRGYPVRLRATVLVFDPLWGMLFMGPAPAHLT